MRLFSIRTVMPVLALLYACQLSAQNPANPIQVALLRWYQANTAAQISTCSSPSGMAFDGSHIWVACSTSTGEVQEFNASDGALVQTITGVEPLTRLPTTARIFGWPTTAITLSQR